MAETCPACGQPMGSPPRARSREDLSRHLQSLRLEVSRLENGNRDVIATQSAAPSCTICEQAPPGKPSDATDTADRVRYLQRQITELERQLRAA